MIDSQQQKPLKKLVLQTRNQQQIVEAKITQQSNTQKQEMIQFDPQNDHYNEQNENTELKDDYLQKQKNEESSVINNHQQLEPSLQNLYQQYHKPSKSQNPMLHAISQKSLTYEASERQTLMQKINTLRKSRQVQKTSSLRNKNEQKYTSQAEQTQSQKIEDEQVFKDRKQEEQQSKNNLSKKYSKIENQQQKDSNKINSQPFQQSRLSPKISPSKQSKQQYKLSQTKPLQFNKVKYTYDAIEHQDQQISMNTDQVSQQIGRSSMMARNQTSDNNVSQIIQKQLMRGKNRSNENKTEQRQKEQSPKRVINESELSVSTSKQKIESQNKKSSILIQKDRNNNNVSNIFSNTNKQQQQISESRFEQSPSQKEFKKEEQLAIQKLKSKSKSKQQYIQKVDGSSNLIMANKSNQMNKQSNQNQNNQLQNIDNDLMKNNKTSKGDQISKANQGEKEDYDDNDHKEKQQEYEYEQKQNENEHKYEDEYEKQPEQLNDKQEQPNKKINQNQSNIQNQSNHQQTSNQTNIQIEQQNQTQVLQENPSVSSATQEEAPLFDMEKYKQAQVILQSLLQQLKSTIKYVKNDRSTHLINIGNNKRGKMQSRFFSRGSRGQQHNSSNSKANKSLVDILQRRKVDRGNLNGNFPINKSFASSVAIQKHQIGGKRKIIPLGLGNFGNLPKHDLIKQISKQQSNDTSHIQQEQRQKLIINRNKINQILAGSSQKFVKTGTNYKGRTHHNRPSGDESSFMHDNQFQQRVNKNVKIIRSSNFIKINKQKGIVSASQLPASKKSTIERQKQKSFFKNHNNDLHFQPQRHSITHILKIIKQYLQIVAQGDIDDIQSLLQIPNDNLLQYGNLHELINRKKLFKSALYLQRASIISGICYGYLQITDQEGMLLYQTHHIKQNGKQISKQALNILKQQIKQILKYMINLVSFCLNNCRLIINTFQQYLLKDIQNTTENQQNQLIDFKVYKHKSPQIQKQIIKRSIQTIKLNVQYIQQTFLKLFTQNVSVTKQARIDQDFGESFKNISKLINKNSIQQTFYSLLQYFAYYLCLIKRQRSVPFLAVAPNPYLDGTQRYTLVIDFIQIFCHGTKKSKNYIFRPYSQHFLNQMSQYYEIVVICDALPQQIDKIIDILDTKNVISHRLYKYHMAQEKHSGKYMKNVERLGRDLSRTIVLDIQQNRLSLESKNTIYINQWKGNKNDSTLAQLCSILISVVVDELNCIKVAQKIDNQMKVNYENGIKYINFGLNLKEDKQQDNQKNQAYSTSNKQLRQSQLIKL